MPHPSNPSSPHTSVPYPLHVVIHPRRFRSLSLFTFLSFGRRHVFHRSFSPYRPTSHTHGTAFLIPDWSYVFQWHRTLHDANPWVRMKWLCWRFCSVLFFSIACDCWYAIGVHFNNDQCSLATYRVHTMQSSRSLVSFPNTEGKQNAQMRNYSATKVRRHHIPRYLLMTAAADTSPNTMGN